jgi:hypothetical protein
MFQIETTRIGRTKPARSHAVEMVNGVARGVANAGLVRWMCRPMCKNHSKFARVNCEIGQGE